MPDSADIYYNFMNYKYYTSKKFNPETNVYALSNVQKYKPSNPNDGTKWADLSIIDKYGGSIRVSTTNSDELLKLDILKTRFLSDTKLIFGIFTEIGNFHEMLIYINNKNPPGAQYLENISITDRQF